MIGFIAGEKILKYDNGNVKKYLEELIGKDIEFEDRKFSFSIGNYNLLLVKSRDVPRILERYTEKTLFGVTGKDWFEEYLLEKSYTTSLRMVKEFPSSAQARVCALTKKGFELENYKNSTVKLVTPYPKIAEEWIKNKGVKSYVIETVYGETEGWIGAGFANISVDTVSSGKTMKANDLKIYEEILRSYTVIISAQRNILRVKKLLGDEK